MVRGIHNLTESEVLFHIKECKRLSITKLLCDGGGLYLRATAAGTASWIFRYEVDGRGREHGLGSYNTYSLEAARKKARKCRKLRDKGKDPIAKKQAERAARQTLKATTAITSKSFKYCLMKYVAFTEASWRSDIHRRNWTRSLERYAYPVFDKGNQLVSTITMKDVLAVLEPAWFEHNETMRRVRARIEAVWDWSKGQGYCTGENPARWKGGLSSHLPKVRKEVKHLAASNYRDIPAIMAALQATPDVIDDALLTCFLTASRTKEVRLADWSEIDLVAGLWTIRGNRMKAGIEHVIPLAESLIQVLLRQPTAPRPGMPRSGFIFCGRGMKALSDGAMLNRFKVLRPDSTVHGSVRSTFAVWSSEVAKARFEVREAALAHGSDPVVRAYLRTSHIGERHALMEQWAEFCLSGNVTPLRAVV
jgi:integrase